LPALLIDRSKTPDVNPEATAQASIQLSPNPGLQWYVYARLAGKIGDDPVLLPLLDVFNPQRGQFRSTQSTAQQNRERRIVALSSKSPHRRLSIEDACLALL
jgi:hypothetical protein